MRKIKTRTQTNRQLIRMLGDLDYAQEFVQNRITANAEKRAIEFADDLNLPDTTSTITPIEQYLDHGARAIQKLREDGADVTLSSHERLGLEAVIHQVGRPALLVRDGQFEQPPKNWQILDSRRNDITKVIRAVGKLEKLIDGRRELLGTGFLVSDQIVMTNRHVLDRFGLLGNKRWIIQRAAEPCIDYDGEFESPRVCDFAVEEVLLADKTLDLALIRVASCSSNGCPPPEPLTLSVSAPEERALYVVGYPALDAYHTHPPAIIAEIFADVFGVKRLQPGELLGIFDEESEFAHDCSTLGGNSGSCIVDLKRGSVAGLHYRGTYLDANFGVALWKLKDRKDIRVSGLNFA